jgi:hypothetical protein
MELDNSAYYPKNFIELADLPYPLTVEQHIRLEFILVQQTEKRKRTFYSFFRKHKTVAQIAEEECVSVSCIRSRLSAVIIHIRWKRGYIIDETSECKK